MSDPNSSLPPPFIPPPQPTRTTDLGISIGKRMIKGPACTTCRGSFWHNYDCPTID